MILASSSFNKTCSTVHWSTSTRLEWNFAFFAALHKLLFGICRCSLHKKWLTPPICSKRTISLGTQFFYMQQVRRFHINCTHNLTVAYFADFCEEESRLSHCFDIQSSDFYHYWKIFDCLSNEKAVMGWKSSSY